MRTLSHADVLQLLLTESGGCCWSVWVHGACAYDVLTTDFVLVSMLLIMCFKPTACCKFQPVPEIVDCNVDISM